MRTPHFGKRLLALVGFFLLLAGGLPAVAAPGDLVDRLIGQLQAANPDRWQDAFYALGEMDDPRIAPALLAMLKNQDERKQSTARAVLFRMRDRITPALIPALQDPDPVCRRAAAAILWQSKDSRALVPLCAALRDPDRETRVIVARVLGAQGDAGAIPALLDALRDPQRGIQDDAAGALGQIGAPVDLLLPLLHDSDPLVRAGAATALGKSKDARTVAPLAALLDDPEEKPRLAAAGALADIGAPAIPSMQKWLESGDAAERVRALDALVRIRERHTAAVLAPALRDPNPQMRIRALHALDVNDVMNRDALAAGLQDPDLSVRRAMLRSMLNLYGFTPPMRYRDSWLVDALLPLLNSPDRALRCGALRALVMLGDQRAVEPIAALLPDKSVRTCAAAALARFGDMRALPPLLKTLSEKFTDETEGASIAALLSPVAAEEMELTQGDFPEDSLRALGTRAIPSLLKLLKTGTAVAKCNAAEVLADSRDFRAVPGLLLLLNEKDLEVRAAAAAALATIGDLRATPRLMQVLRHDPDGDVRCAAAYGLGEPSDTRPIPALLAALKDSDPRVRGAVFCALEGTRDPRVIAPMLAVLKGKNAEERAGALKVLGAMHHPRAIPALLKALSGIPLDEQVKMEDMFRGERDPRMVCYYAKLLDSYHSYWQRGKIALLLAWMKDPRAISPLLESLRAENYVSPYEAAESLACLGRAAVEPCLKALQEPFPGKRAVAARTLGLLKERRAVPQLITLLRDPDGRVREGAARALADIADPRATDALIAALADEGDSVVTAAAEGLGRLRAERALTPLLTVLQRKARSGGDSRQRAAAEALGALGNPAAIPPLLALLSDPSASLCNAAADSLGKLKARQAIAALRELLTDPDPSVRYSAAGALARIGDKKGLRVLCEMLRFHPIGEAGGYDRVQAAERLGALENRTAVPALIAALQDADPAVRQAAARALARLKDRRAVAPLLENLWHHDPAVRKTTATALAALTGRQFGTNAERWFAWWKKQHG